MHVEPGALAGAMARLAELAPGGTVEQSLRQVADAAVAVFRVTGCGLMILDDAQVLRYVVSTDEAGRILETAQERVGEGPCVDALVLDIEVLTGDVAHDERWPRLGPELEGAPVRGVLGVPVHLGGGAVGSLNLYTADSYDWDDSDIAAVRAFNTTIEDVLAMALMAQRRDETVAQLQAALDHRVAIERAVGLLMGRFDVGPVEAFRMLRGEARSRRRKVHDLAEGLLAGEVEVPRSP